LWELQTSPPDTPCFVYLWHHRFPPSAPLCRRRSPPVPRPRFHLKLLYVPRCRLMLSHRCFPLSLASRERATTPRAIAGRHLLVAVDRPPRRLNSLSRARSSTTSTPTLYSATPSAQFRASELHSAAAVLFRSGRTLHHRGQPSPSTLRLHRSP
jgi:hypothetical protein